LTGDLPRDDGRALDELDRALLESLDHGFSVARARAGEKLVCRAGCDSCCRTLFPITALDARRLRDGMRELHEGSGDRANAIRLRAKERMESILEQTPELMRDGRLTDEVALLDAAFEHHVGMPCPALDADGRCELYASRPVACRSYGPPLDFGGVKSAPCELCFVDADADELDRCRLRPDPQGLERRALHKLGEDGEWRALIAQVLAE